MIKQRRGLIFAVVALLALGAAHASGVGDALSVDALRGWMTSAGPGGVLVFLVTFAASALLALPALVFILAALAAYGPALGLPVAFVGSLLAATVAFLGVRCAKGESSGAPTSSLKLPTRFRCALRVVADHPIAVVAGLRSLLLLSAPLNLALALSTIRYRDYITGTAVGLVPPLVLYGATIECWLG